MSNDVKAMAVAAALVVGGAIGGMVLSADSSPAPAKALTTCDPNGRPEMVAEARDAGWCK